VFIKTYFTFNNWLTNLFWNLARQITGLSVVDGWCMTFDGLVVRTNAQASVCDALGKGDRRKPAYMQLRRAWENLDNRSKQDALDWVLQSTMLDPLSGLETLPAKEISGPKPEGWVDAISDLNALKAINDMWGHEAGDQVIRALGKIVKAEVVREGGRAFRIGGDEFCYWFPDTEAAKRALERIDAKFQAATFSIGGQKREGFSISYGIGPDVTAADNALYQDKERRKRLGQRAERGQLPISIAIAV